MPSPSNTPSNTPSSTRSHRSWAVLLVAGLGLLAGLAIGATGCDASSDPIFDLGLVTGTNPVSAPGAAMKITARDANRVEVQSLKVVHLYGVTSCPQDIGIITIENTTDAAATADFTLSVAAPLVAVPSSRVIVAPGTVESVTLRFTCAAADDFSTSIDVSVSNGSVTETTSVPTTLSVLGL